MIREDRQMSKGIAGKNTWALALLILIGVVIGGL